ncbi:putative RNA recognition motif domain, nucleotide-binding alpha-beta plait domain superfamily [Helianthus annuus]|nr:putative RNA recognition motif domain, nucleotide-binding alpha-beta plait domain superfamily [Helianthus annuus]
MSICNISRNEMMVVKKKSFKSDQKKTPRSYSHVSEREAAGDMDGRKKGRGLEEGHGLGSNGITKFYVARLPERCSSKDIEKVFGVFGSIKGVYVARKRDKHGFRFGFVSFTGVKDMADLERSMQNVWMGNYKLFVNIAKFLIENEGEADKKDSKGKNKT